MGTARGRKFRAFLACAVSSAASLAAGEGWCRARYGVPIREKLPIMPVVGHPRRGYAMVPGTEHYTSGRCA